MARIRDALQKSFLERSQRLIGLINRMRLFAPAEVVAEAEAVFRAILEILLKPKIELRVWVDANGIPIAAERDSNYSASFIVVSASNIRKEHWEFAVFGDRLYAARGDEENRASVVGKSVLSSRTVMYVPKAVAQ